MIELFQIYLDYFLHPFKTNHDFNQQRLALSEKKIERLTFVESISISWLLMALKSLIWGLFIVLFLKYIAPSLEFSFLKKNAIDLSEFKDVSVYLYLVLELVFFPLMAWFWLEFWKLMIIAGRYLFEKNFTNEDISQVLVVAMSSHIIKIVPFFGDFLFMLSSGLAIFAGLRENLQLGVGQGLFILVTPLLLLCGLFFILFLVLIFFIAELTLLAPF